MSGPIGQREDQRLEFKAAAALDQQKRLAREVAAFLNANGGVLWIGVRDEGDVAVALEPLADADAARARLLDALLDLLDPPPRDELVVEVVSVGEARVLRVTATPDKTRGPYAVHTATGATWEFPRRVDHRVRPMTRDELQAEFAGAAIRADALHQDVRERWDTLRESAPDGLLVCAVPLQPRGIPPGDPKRETLLTARAPRGEFTFANPWVTPTRGDHGTGWEVSGARRAWIGDDGSVLATAWPSQFALRAAVLDVESFAGIVLAALMLTAAVHREFPGANKVFLSAELRGMTGWRLPGLEDRGLYDPPPPLERDVVWARPLEAPVTDLIRDPAATARELVLRVFGELGVARDEARRLLRYPAR